MMEKPGPVAHSCMDRDKAAEAKNDAIEKEGKRDIDVVQKLGKGN